MIREAGSTARCTLARRLSLSLLLGAGAPACGDDTSGVGGGGGSEASTTTGSASSGTSSSSTSGSGSTSSVSTTSTGGQGGEGGQNAGGQSAGGGGADQGGGGAGQGGGEPGDCARDIAGTHLLAVAVQLDPDKPFFFSAEVEVVEVDGGFSADVSITPLRTPYREAPDTEGIAVLAPVGPALTLPTISVEADGTFTSAPFDLAIPGVAGPFSANDFQVDDVELLGTLVEGLSLCGNLRGQVTEPIPLVLEEEKNFFRMDVVARPLGDLPYDCDGSLADPVCSP